MTTDDDMREIEAALYEFQDASERVYEASPDPGFGDPVQLQKDARKALLALIRQKLEAAKQTDAEWLQAPLTEREKASTELAGKVVVPWTDDAEHERAVEAWRAKLRRSVLMWNGPQSEKAVTNEALRLMRARPFYRDLSQVTAEIRREASGNACEDYAAGLHRAADIIEAAERTGIEKNLPT